MERTFSIIKPDAVCRNLIGTIQKRFEENGLSIVACKMLHMTRNQAESFYAEHQGRDFYEPLINYMISGPCVVQVLEGEEAIIRNRQVMGATDPQKAESGTIRADFAHSTRENCVHGSDSVESANREIGFFFSQTELCPRD